MPGESIFSEDWRDCLKSHYQTVVREQDTRTERTLRGVMFHVGFSEDELNELRLLATMHVDDVGADFVPDLQMFAAVVAPVGEAEVVGVGAVRSDDRREEPPLRNELPTDEITAETEAAPEIELLEKKDAESEAAEVEESPPYDEAGPQQLSMF